MQAGIVLPAAQRARMAELSNANHHFAASFNAALSDPRKLGSIKVQGGQGGGIFSGWSRSVPLDTGSVGAVLATEPEEEVRKQASDHL